MCAQTVAYVTFLGPSYMTYFYRWENENSVSFNLPIHKIIMLNVHDLSETLFRIKSQLGGVKLGPIMCLR
jgi:hypothetical protein